MGAITNYKDLSIGDVVNLISGGPDMTIVGFGPSEPVPANYVPPQGTKVATTDEPAVQVAWLMTDGALGQARFPSEALNAKTKKADAKKPTPAPSPAAAV